MAYKTYTRSMLATFTGRPEASFPQAFVDNSAIPQALLLFKVATCLKDPAGLDADQLKLIDYAVLSMADALHLGAPYQAAKASPFSSESIGSYSYSKAAQAVKRGDETGVMWFDLAVSQLGVCDTTDGDFQRGGIEMFEHDAALAPGTLTGNTAFQSPTDQTYRVPDLFGADTVPLTWVEDPPGSGLYVQSIGS